MKGKRVCPNCYAPVEEHEANGCVLAALMQLVRDRGNLDDEALLNLHANANADAFWDDLGPIIDGLEDGHYTTKEEE
jgi:hypothetical protein